MASRFSSMTMRMPSRLLSSQMSEMPSTRFSRTRSAIFSISVFLLTWYGMAVTTSASRSLRISSTSTLAAHDDGAAALVIGGERAGAPEDQAAGRKIRPLDDLRQVLDGDLGIVEHRGWTRR